MIELNGVAKQYLYGARVLGVTDMRIDDGEIIAVVGGEGSGKTTFLKVLAGVESCEGEVLFNGSPVTLKTDDVIMMFDDMAMFKHRSLRYNVGYPLAVRRVDRREIKERVDAAAALTGAAGALDTPAGRADIEDLRRAAAARLFIRDAKLLILDEPCRGLDRMRAKAFWSELAPLLQQKKEEGVTVVFSTSDIAEAVSIADRIVALNAGAIKQIGTRNELYYSPSSVWAAEAVDENYNAVFAELGIKDGKPFAKTECGEIDLSLSAHKIRGEYTGKKVILGVHSEDFIKVSEADMPVPIKVKYCEGAGGGYILHTENGWKILSDEPCKSVRALPDGSRVLLFDSRNECSIMKYENKSDCGKTNAITDSADDGERKQK